MEHFYLKLLFAIKFCKENISFMLKFLFFDQYKQASMLHKPKNLTFPLHLMSLNFLP